MLQRFDIGATIPAEALVRFAAAGQTIVIERGGEEILRLVKDSAVAARPRRRRLGLARGMVQIADDFDELPPELLAAFEGDDPDPE